MNVSSTKARRIFVNGVHAKTGGGKSILSNYLSLLKARNLGDKYIILTPSKREYERYSAANVEIIELADRYNKHALFPVLYRFILPRLLKKHRIDAIFNLGDVVIPSRTPQLYCFDWPYAVYPKSTAWKRLDLKGYLSRKVKLLYFRRYLRHATTIITQSRVMEDRLRSIYGVTNTVIVPNAVSLENISGGERVDFCLPSGKIKLLYLTHYYPHKNLEVFIPLAQRIRRRSLPFCLVTTIGATQHKKAKQFLDGIKTRGLEDVIINLGPISMANVPSLYEQSDALLMPTLLESFSGTYVEAMYHKKTILTSKLDFAEDVCGDASFYFDPLNSESILDTIVQAFGNEPLRRRKIELGADRLSKMLTWDQVFDRYQDMLNKIPLPEPAGVHDLFRPL